MQKVNFAGEEFVVYGEKKFFEIRDGVIFINGEETVCTVELDKKGVEMFYKKGQFVIRNADYKFFMETFVY